MRFAIYARKSTESEDRQVQSLDDQIRELRSLARREDFTIAEIFQESRSAKAPGNRPEFDRLVRDVESGEIDGILTWAINRLSRNPVDGGRVAYLLQTGKLSMIRTIERTYVPEDNALLLSIENGMATAYIQDLSRNVKRGMQGKFERGWQASKAPVGYKNDLETGQIIADPTRFAPVREAWDMLLGGEQSVEQIARAVRSKGLTVSSRRRPARVVSRNTFHRMFRNRFYAGEIRWNNQVKIGCHPKMVSEEEFEFAQEILRRKHRSTRKTKHNFAFRGAFVCRDCGCSIVAERKCKTYLSTNRTVEYTYYHCSGRRGCSKQAKREDQIVEELKDLATKLTISPRYLRWLNVTLPQAIERRFAKHVGDTPSSNEEIEKVKSRLDALVTLRADGEIAQPEFTRARHQALSRLADLNKANRKKAPQPTQLLESGKQKLFTFELAREIRQNSKSLERFGELARKLGPSRFRPNSSGLEIALTLQKIAAFEPLVLGSQKSENDDELHSNTIWLTFWEEVLNLLEVEMAQRNDANN